MPSYVAGVIVYGLIRFLVSKNRMIEKRILSLSPIGKELGGGSPTSYGRHLGFHALGARYWAGVIRYGLIRFLVSKNHMIEKRILRLSPIGKKLGGVPTSSGRHLGF